MERKERMDTSSLMEQILSSDNLNRAYLQVVRNKGAEGMDVKFVPFLFARHGRALTGVSPEHA